MISSSDNTSWMKNSTDKSHADSTFWRVLLAPSILLMLAILFGNSLVIASYKTNRRLTTRTNAFLVSLSISDFLVGSISLPMWIYMKGTEKNLWNVSAVFAALFKSFDVFSALASVFHLTAISVERYIAVSRPFYYKSLPSLFHRALIASAWSAAGFLASLSFFTALEKAWSSRIYSVVLLVCGFAGPTVVITCMYVGVFAVARSLLKRFPSHATSQQHRGSLRQYYQGERKVAITVGLITCLFIAAWVPFFAVSVTAAFCLNCLPSSPDTLFALIAIVKSVHYMNSAVNPLVYARRDQEMRRTFLRLLGVRWCGICRLDFEEETPATFPLQDL